MRPQSKLCAVLVEKLEAGYEKNNICNACHCFPQGFECYNLSTAFNLTRLKFKRFTSQIQEIQLSFKGLKISSAGFGCAHLAPVCTSVLIAHWNQVCTGLFPRCAHLILQFLKCAQTVHGSVHAVCAKVCTSVHAVCTLQHILVIHIQHKVPYNVQRFNNSILHSIDV